MTSRPSGISNELADSGMVRIVWVVRQYPVVALTIGIGVLGLSSWRVARTLLRVG